MVAAYLADVYVLAKNPGTLNMRLNESKCWAKEIDACKPERIIGLAYKEP